MIKHFFMTTLEKFKTCHIFKPKSFNSQLKLINFIKKKIMFLVSDVWSKNQLDDDIFIFSNQLHICRGCFELDKINN